MNLLQKMSCYCSQIFNWYVSTYFILIKVKKVENVKEKEKKFTLPLILSMMTLNIF